MPRGPWQRGIKPAEQVVGTATGPAMGAQEQLPHREFKVYS
jgi:hypothetical protein